MVVAATRGAAPDAQLAGALTAFNTVRRAYAELMSVLAYESRQGQEALLHARALPELLAMCKIDDQNPSSLSSPQRLAPCT